MILILLGQFLPVFGMKNRLEEYKKLPGSDGFKKIMKNVTVGPAYSFLCSIINKKKGMMEKKFGDTIGYVGRLAGAPKHMVKGMLEAEYKVREILESVEAKKKDIKKNISITTELEKELVKTDKKTLKLLPKRIGTYISEIVFGYLGPNKKKVSETIVKKMIMGNKKILCISKILEWATGFVIGECVKKDKSWKKFFGKMTDQAYKNWKPKKEEK